MVGIRRFKFVLGIFIPFVAIFLMSQNTSAAEYNRWLNIQHITKSNLNSNWTTYNQANASGFTVTGATSFDTYRLSASANLPSPATGAYYSASGDIYLDVANILEGGVLCNLINDANIEPEYVSYNTSSSRLTSCSVSYQTPNVYYRRYTLHIEASGSIPSQATFQSFAWTIGNTSQQSIISLIGTPDDSPGVLVSGNFNISIGTSPELEGLGVINQNITIISQDLKDMQQQMTENTEAIINNQNENTQAIIESNQTCRMSKNLVNIDDFTLNRSSNRYYSYSLPEILPAGTYTLSYNYSVSNDPSVSLQVFYSTSDPQAYLNITSLGSVTFTAAHPMNRFYFYITTSSPSDSTVTLSDIMLVSGRSSQPYEPYGEEVCKNINQDYYDEQRQAGQNISNQSAADIEGAENQTTTNLIGVLSGFISAFSNISATNCNVTLNFPNYAGGTKVVNICSGKDKAPRIVEIGSSLLLIGVFVPLAYILIKMIYNEIRSWTNG